MGSSDGLGTPGESIQLGSSDGHPLGVALLLHGTAKRIQGTQCTKALVGSEHNQTRASSELRVKRGGGCCLYPQGAAKGDLAYLNEPVNAFSVANCPGTVSRRVHTRMSSSHCAVSCRGKEKTGCHCFDWTEGYPPHTHTYRLSEQPPGGTGGSGKGWYW